ncbi:MAG: nucleotide-binding protein [Methylococcales bacterium]
MAQKVTTTETQQFAELSISRDEAKAKLEERVQKGQEIQSSPIQSQQDIDVAQNEYDKWDAFNTELLQRTIFTTDKFAKEYSRYIYGSDFYEKLDKKIHKLDSIIGRLELIPLAHSATQENMKSEKLHQPIEKSNKIFIVHGRDDLAKTETARFIEKLGFEAIILHEQASGNKTIIEKIEEHTNVGFAIVLYTPCDVGSLAGESSQKPRARQNVVFEHGYLIGKLGRQNVCALVKGDVEIPNDISGVVYISLDNHNAWHMAIAKELKKAGYPVDMNKMI